MKGVVGGEGGGTVKGLVVSPSVAGTTWGLRGSPCKAGGCLSSCTIMTLQGYRWCYLSARVARAMSLHVLMI